MAEELVAAYEDRRFTVVPDFVADFVAATMPLWNGDIPSRREVSRLVALGASAAREQTPL